MKLYQNGVILTMVQRAAGRERWQWRGTASFRWAKRRS